MGLDKPNYTQVANLILDDLMKYMSGAELKVVLVISRQTLGYHREKFPMTISTIEELTGLSRPAVVEAIDVGERRNLIKREQLANGRWAYSLVINDEVLAASKENLPVPVKKVYRRSKKSLPKSVKKSSIATPVLKKEKESIKEREDEDDPRAGNPIEAAWFEIYGSYMPENILQPMKRLLSQCSEEAVIHAIIASTGAESRSFKYIAKCACNYIPPVPTNSRGNGKYSVEIQPRPGLPLLSPAAVAHQPVASSDPWATALAELRQAHAGADWMATLEGSRLQAAGEVRDNGGQPKPLYRVHVTATANINWLAGRAGGQIRHKLGTIFGRSVLIEIVACVAESGEEDRR